MKLTQKQHDYLTKRKKLLESWRYAGPALLLGILGLTVYLYIKTPLLINPHEVFLRVESQAIRQSTLETMAILLPILFIMVCFFLIVLVAIMYAAFSNEKNIW